MTKPDDCDDSFGRDPPTDDYVFGGAPMAKPAKVPLLFRACKGHSVRVVDPKRMRVKCDAPARRSHQAVVIPLGDASVRRSMAGHVAAPQRDLQGVVS
eukprot:242638-Pyramimonas_sp.AAC.1